MPVRKRGDRWHVRLQVNGQRIERSLGPAATKAEAKAYEAQIRQDVINGKLHKAPKRSLEDAILRWLEGEAAQLRDRAGIINKTRAIRPYCQGRSMEQIVEAAEAVKASGIKAGLKPATINRRLAILRRIANLAHDQWEWLDQPLGRRIKLLGGEKPRMVYLTVAQAEVFIDTIAERSRAAVLIYLMTGMRVSELLRFDPRKHLVDGHIFLDTSTKTGRPRIIPLTTEAAEAVSKWKPGQVTYNTLRKDFEEAREQAGMPWLQMRDMRRTFGSWIMQRTQSLKITQDLLGHTTPSITNAHYAFLLNTNLQQAVATLPNLSAAGQKRGNEEEETSNHGA